MNAKNDSAYLPNPLGAQTANPHAVSIGQHSLLDTTGWSILQFELAYDGLVAMAAGGNSILCQPRAKDQPGASVVADLIDHGIHLTVTAIADRLRRLRFDDPGDDDRRERLLLRYELDHPDGRLSEALHLVLGLPARHAA